MNKTQNLNLGKPLVNEKYDISIFNENADKIDAAIETLQNKTINASIQNKGIVMLNDNINSNSITTAATANSVKQVNDKIEAKVDKVTGKGLSSNDLTDDLKANYNAAFSHSISQHARSDATLVQKSNINGNIKINGNENTVYTHPFFHKASMITEDSAHRFVTDEEKSSYADKYTKNEVDNKLAALETNIDWKESVDTFSDIAAAYPNPQDGWTVNVKDTDYTYRYNGSSWVTISANAIPKATSSVDGLLSKEDKTNLDDANVKKHTHSNKAVLDGITAENVQTWNNAADNNALTLEKYIRSDKHAIIYNNFDVYAKDTTINPLLKIRPDRIDILKTDSSGTISAKSTGMIMKDKIRYQLDSLDTYIELQNLDASKADVTIRSERNIQILGRGIINGTTGNRLSLFGSNITLAGPYLGLINGGAYFGIIKNDGNFNPDTLDQYNSSLNYGLDIQTNGDIHIFSNQFKIGNRDSYFIEVTPDTDNIYYREIKIRNGYGESISLLPTGHNYFKNKISGAIKVNGDVVLSVGDTVYFYPTNKIYNFFLQNYSLQNLILALIRKTGLCNEDIEA